MENKLLSTSLISSLSLSNHPNRLPPASVVPLIPSYSIKNNQKSWIRVKNLFRVSRSDHALRYSHYYTLKQFVNAILYIYMCYIFVTSKLIVVALFYICICDIQINQLRLLQSNIILCVLGIENHYQNLFVARCITQLFITLINKILVLLFIHRGLS